MDDNQKGLVSFVVPLFNEEECIEELYSRIRKTAESIGMEFELVCINDNSYDSTLGLLRKLREQDPRVKFVSFSRNFGHQLAVTAGLRYASGDCVVVVDADLQDPPEVVIEMVKKWQEGFDVVYGIRKNRKENWFKKTCYKIFYRILHKISFLDIPVDVGDFCLMSRRTVNEMRKFSEARPFVRGLRSWVGFKQTGIEYERAGRLAGTSKYNLLGLFRLALDGILSFSVVLPRVAAVIGLFISFISISYAVYIIISTILITFGIIINESFIPGWATLVCSILFLMGLQFIFIGILGEYIGRIFIQVKDRPLFIVEEEVGFGDNQ